MVEFVMNNLGTIIVGAIVLAIIVGILIKEIRDRRRGKHKCGGDCGVCSGCARSEVRKK